MGAVESVMNMHIKGAVGIPIAAPKPRLSPRVGRLVRVATMGDAIDAMEPRLSGIQNKLEDDERLAAKYGNPTVLKRVRDARLALLDHEVMRARRAYLSCREGLGPRHPVVRVKREELGLACLRRWRFLHPEASGMLPVYRKLLHCLSVLEAKEGIRQRMAAAERGTAADGSWKGEIL